MVQVRSVKECIHGERKEGDEKKPRSLMGIYTRQPMSGVYGILWCCVGFVMVMMMIMAGWWLVWWSRFGLGVSANSREKNRNMYILSVDEESPHNV